MGGSAMYDDWELTSCDGARTIVLIGRTGNGKSATGNSILGKKAFKSKATLSSVTSTCELQKRVMPSGQTINVIDTPGLFDVSVESEFVGKEIHKCVTMAKDGIHAVLVVVSVTGRFSQEEAAILEGLRNLFGRKIIDYMIVVFTGGDKLEDDEETLEGYLSTEAPQALKEILALCKNRFVLFDNKTKDRAKQDEQLHQLLILVETVIAQNGGQPYTDEIFVEFKMGEMKILDLQKQVESLKGSPKGEILEMKELINRTYDEQSKRIMELVESKLRHATMRLEQQLKKEQEARLEAEKMAQTAQKVAHEEIRKLRENLERATRETDELRKKSNGACNIL